MLYKHAVHRFGILPQEICRAQRFSIHYDLQGVSVVLSDSKEGKDFLLTADWPPGREKAVVSRRLRLSRLVQGGILQLLSKVVQCQAQFYNALKS